MAAQVNIRRDSVVHISCAKSAGSGFHYGNGWIVTCSHVVGKGADFLEDSSIKLADGTVILPQPRKCFFGKLTGTEGAALGDAPLDVAVFKLHNEEYREVVYNSKARPQASKDTILANASMNRQGIENPAVLMNEEEIPHARVNDVTYCYHWPGDNIELSENNAVLTSTENWFSCKSTNGQSAIRPGSSGSPVFDSTSHLLVGLLFAGTGNAQEWAAIQISVVRRFLKELLDPMADVKRFLQMDKLNNFPQLEAGKNQLIQRLQEKLTGLEIDVTF